MNFIKASILILLISVLFSSCKKGGGIQLTQKEYHLKKNEGFWTIRNKKAITYNHNVAKPKRDRDLRKLARENKHREKYNAKNAKRWQDNETLHKTFDHN